MIFSFLIATALAQAPSQVPTIVADDFVPGRTWTWDYFQGPQSIYSTESYVVLSRTGDVVLIEMRSSYGGDPQLRAHHRLEVNVRECLRAYSNPVQRKPWSIAMYSLERGRWVKYQPDKTLAFEEKFNCNPHVQTKPSDPYKTVFASIDGERVFQQMLWRRLTSSWFSLDGVERGVAWQKEFSADPRAPYSMKRRP